jgi:molybdate transport system ATP-binding protein
MRWKFKLHKKFLSSHRHFEINVDVESNSDNLVLFGPSGSGKTQILKMLSGLVQPDSGLIQFDGIDLWNSDSEINLSPQARGLAYVFQEYALFPHLTVIQNIAFALNKSWFNQNYTQAIPMVEEWLDKLQLRAIAHQFPHQISGGQSQRVALARAIMSQPKALLLDEPFASLDDHLRKNLRLELAELQKQIGIPMILITHSQEDVDVLGDEVFHLANGLIVN